MLFGTDLVTVVRVRTFLSTESFEGLESKEVVQLVQLELGRDGRDMVAEPKNHPFLIQMIRQQLGLAGDGAQQTSPRWMTECGIKYVYLRPARHQANCCCCGAAVCSWTACSAWCTRLRI